ncbi:MAG: hypothetical protein KDB82_02720 [Planctomycetes bacterium]|nr:hypothetical protein [Planctomycetota bacterium]
MELFDQYSALLALGMPPCLPKPRDADTEAPAGWHWSGLADLPPEAARRTLESFAVEWFLNEFGMLSLLRTGGGVELHSIRREASKPGRPRPLRKRLGELLLERGVIFEDQLENVLKIHRRTGRRLGEILLETNTLTPDELLPVLAEKLGVMTVSGEAMKQSATPEAAFAIEERVCRRHNVLCLIEDKDRLQVAMADPTDVILIDTLRAVTRKEILPILADPAAIADTIDRVFLLDEPGYSAGPVVKYVDATLREVVRQGATGVRFTPTSTDLAVEFLFDELIGTATAPPLRLYPRVVARLKVILGLDPAQSGVPANAEAEYTLEGDVLRLKLEVSPGEFGETVLLKVRLVREAPSRTHNIDPSELAPVSVHGASVLDAIILAVRRIRGDSDEGTGIHAKLPV